SAPANAVHKGSVMHGKAWNGMEILGYRMVILLRRSPHNGNVTEPKIPSIPIPAQPASLDTASTKARLLPCLRVGKESSPSTRSSRRHYCPQKGI
ncbi:hypothetical protein BaRGS_00005593, partial [Batillaria attramentaria]